MTTIGVVGATGALGKEILAVLDKAPWRPERVLAYASPRSEIPTVDYGDDSIPVDDLEHANLEDLDALLIATPSDVAREIGERAIGDGVAVVDCTGVFAQDDDVPMVVPWVNPEALRDMPPRGVLAIPSAAALMIGSVLGPLRRAGLAGPTTATLLMPASDAGRAGIDELSRQVVALFNSATPPRKVFDQGLAFDLLPQLGDAGADGWTDREARTAHEVARMTGVSPTVTLVGVPVFSGISGTLIVETPDVPVDRVVQILIDGGVQVPKGGSRALPRPRKVEGHPFVHVGRVRRDGAGRLHLWASVDNLRGSAAVAVGCAGALVKARKSAS
jgi:aspartate-semialdehyde dehydrogenase